MRCKARARGVQQPRTITAIGRSVSPDKFYSGRLRVDLPLEQAGLLSTVHIEQRLDVTQFANFADTSQLLSNQCCELRVSGNGKSAWGIYKEQNGVGYLRRVNTRPSERFGPCNPEQACARELIMDEETLVVSLVGIAGTGKTLMALLSAYELYRAGRVHRSRSLINARPPAAGLPAIRRRWRRGAKPIIDNLDFILKRMAIREVCQLVSDQQPDRRARSPGPSVAELLEKNVRRSRRSTTCAGGDP